MAGIRLLRDTYDPGQPWLALSVAMKKHQGLDRYAMFGLRAHMFVDESSGPVEVAVFETARKGHPDYRRADAGGGGFRLRALASLQPHIPVMRKAGVARLVIDELRAQQTVTPGFAELRVPLKFDSWDFSHPESAPPTPGTGKMDSDGRRHGEWRETKKNGYSNVGRYAHGKKDGTWAHFAGDGTKTGETTYRSGVQHGPWWAKTATDQTKGVYADGLYQGRFTHVSMIANSQFGTAGVYEKGKKTGVWVEIAKGKDFGGLHRTEETYVLGVIQLAVSTRNGEKCEVVPYKNGKKHGKREVWFAGGAPRLIEQYVAGVLRGPSHNWHRNGKKKNEAEYENGKRTGTFKEWDDTGRLLNHWVTRNRRRIGLVVGGRVVATPGR